MSVSLQPARCSTHGSKVSSQSWHSTIKFLRKMLCYSLAIMLVPVTLPFRDFEQLCQAFTATDKDDDGLIARQHARTILRQRCPLKEAVDAALAITDIHKSDVFDLCATACA